MIRKMFSDKAGKVVFVCVERLFAAHQIGTLRVSACTYPVGPGCYSSFVDTKESLSFVESVIGKIGEQFLSENLYGSKEISDALSLHVKPIGGRV